MTLPRSKSILDEIEEKYRAIDWNKLMTNGYHKKGDYCFIYSYPPVRALEPLETNDIFKHSIWEPVQDTINLYIHIPYCTGICSYCYFARVIDNKSSPISKDAYIDLLISEIDGKISRYNSDVVIDNIHFGGGTPSVLDEPQIIKIMNYLRGLRLTQGVEITFECSPDTIQDIEKIKMFKHYGINRINIGVESLDDHVLKRMGRRHGSLETYKAIENTKRAGFNNINIDLIYALPNETLDSWIQTLHRCIELQIDSISVYRLRRHPNKSISHLSEKMFPTYEDSLKMQIAHSVIFKNSSYIQVQSHKYALGENKIQKQTEKKRGMGKNQLLGAGCGSYGFLNGTLYWNYKSLSEYGEKVRCQIQPTWIGQSLNKEELMRKAFVLGFHTSRGIDINIFKTKYSENPLIYFKKELDTAFNLGLLQLKDDVILPTDLGYFFGDELGLAFYSDMIKSKLSPLDMRYGMFFENDKYI